jgi:alditol oxidase
VERNWAGNHAYGARALHRPATLEELRELIARSPRIRVLGTRHCFHAIADSDELVSLERLPAGVEVDEGAGTVTCPGAMTYGALAAALAPHRLALANLASLPHISVAGAVATATHGSGDRNGNLATAVAGLQLVTSDGGLRTVRRGDPDFAGHVVALGALGAVVRVELDAEPAYEVRQVVFEDLAWEALLGRLDEVFASAYAVSVFTRWGERVDQVWLKQRDEAPRTGLLGARPATEERHPILGNDPVNATAQLGRPGPWADRLPHFRLEFTPSNGEELQSEYLLPRRHAAAAIEAVRAVAPAFRDLVLVSELRTVAADDLWLSPQHETDTLGIHFTWVREPDRVERAARLVEDALAPFEPRPHWGKLFFTGRDELAARYPRLADFRALAARLDPRGAFRNPWLEERIL